MTREQKKIIKKIKKNAFHQYNQVKPFQKTRVIGEMMKTEIKENIDYILHKEHGREYYHFIGDPKDLLLVQFVIEYAQKNVPEVNIQKRHACCIASLLFTTFMDLENRISVEKNNSDNGIRTDYKYMIVPSSKSYYTQKSTRPNQSMPYIKGVGRDLIETTLRLIGKESPRKKSRELSRSPMIIHIDEGDSIKAIGDEGHGISRRFRTIHMKRFEEWGMWCRKEFSPQDLLKAYAGYQQFKSFRKAIKDSKKSKSEILKSKYMAVIKGTTKISMGEDYNEGPSKNENAYYTVAPADICKEMQVINSGFGEHIDILKYVRVFNQDVQTGGRLFGPFSNLNKTIRNNLLDKLKLVEVDIKNCAVNIFSLLNSGNWIKGDFYEELAIQTGKKMSFNSPELSPFHNQHGELFKAWRKVLKKVVTIAVGAKSKPNGKSAIQFELSRIGIFNSKEDIVTGAPKRTDYSKWSKFLSGIGDSSAPFHKINVFDIYESLKDLTGSTFFDYLFSNSSGISMNIESNALVRVLKDMVSKGYLPLACHDAVFVPIGTEDYYERLFKQYIEEEAAKYKQALQRTA